MREINAAGFFWSPDDPDERIEGLLTFKADEGGILKLFFGRFTKPMQNSTMQISVSKKFNYLCGFVNDIGEVALINCRSHVSFGGGFGDRITFETLIIGNDFADNEPLFDTLTFSLTHLADWLVTESNIQTRFWSDTSSESMYQTELKRPKPIEYLFPSYRISFWIGASVHHPYGSITYKDSASVTISLQQPITFDEFFKKHIYPFKEFVEFATDRQNMITRVLCWEEDTNQDQKQKIEFLFKEKDPINPIEKGDIESLRNLIFSLGDIKHTFGTHYHIWFRERDRLRDIVQLYLMLRKEQLYSNIALLLLTQALEAYHREFQAGLYIDETEWETVSQKFIDFAGQEVTDKALRGKIKTTFKYLNEYSQRKRFKDILKNTLLPISEYVNIIFGETSKEKNNFADDVVNIRNYHTHLASDEEVKDLPQMNSERAYNKMIWKLDVMLLACLLLELKLPPKTVVILLERNSERRNGVI